MIRRFHVRQLRTGFMDLGTAEAHHVRDVLRLTVGTSLELFDDAGLTATGPLVMVNTSVVRVDITTVNAEPPRAFQLTVAAAIPKGDRADWMVEKLSELGVYQFIPLATERSVVLPAGRNKIERWERAAVESAKQSRRTGVMQIAALTPLSVAISQITPGWYLSTAPEAASIRDKVDTARSAMRLSLLIGPEGGWSKDELQQFHEAKFEGIALTGTVLRVETAAVVAAGVMLCLR